jgi:hypothetical protein
MKKVFMVADFVAVEMHLCIYYLQQCSKDFNFYFRRQFNTTNRK